MVGVDDADSAALQTNTAPLKSNGVNIRLGVTSVPPLPFDLAVISPEVSPESPLYRDVVARGIPMLGELELGFELAQCLAVAITGTNGKGTVADMVEQFIRADGRRALTAGHRARPICSIVERTKDLDFLILQVKAQQLEQAKSIAPSVAVLMNVSPDHLDRYASGDDYIRTYATVFRNQQPFDWAIIQSEALERLRALNIKIPGKLVTFSATDSSADLYLDRGLILSRLPHWEGQLLDTSHCELRGPHNAENLMAALAVGHALHIPLDLMVDAARACMPAAHRFEQVANLNGIRFINDSKATNLDALCQALRTVQPAAGGHPNIWLIAGGRGKGLDYHGAGPLLSQCVKGIFLIGEESENLRAAWGLFTPCTPVGSLLEAVAEAARLASEGDVILLSPACSSFDQFRDYQHRGEVFCQAAKTICGGVSSGSPKIHGG